MNALLKLMCLVAAMSVWMGAGAAMGVDGCEPPVSGEVKPSEPTRTVSVEVTVTSEGKPLVGIPIDGTVATGVWEGDH